MKLKFIYNNILSKISNEKSLFVTFYFKEGVKLLHQARINQLHLEEITTKKAYKIFEDKYDTDLSCCIDAQYLKDYFKL
jgi:hypothetical protein